MPLQEVVGVPTAASGTTHTEHAAMAASSTTSAPPTTSASASATSTTAALGAKKTFCACRCDESHAFLKHHLQNTQFPQADADIDDEPELLPDDAPPPKQPCPHDSHDAEAPEARELTCLGEWKP